MIFDGSHSKLASRLLRIVSQGVRDSCKSYHKQIVCSPHLLGSIFSKRPSHQNCASVLSDNLGCSQSMFQEINGLDSRNSSHRNGGKRTILSVFFQSAFPTIVGERLRLSRNREEFRTRFLPILLPTTSTILTVLHWIEIHVPNFRNWCFFLRPLSVQVSHKYRFHNSEPESFLSEILRSEFAKKTSRLEWFSDFPRIVESHPSLSFQSITNTLAFFERVTKISFRGQFSFCSFVVRISESLSVVNNVFCGRAFTNQSF